MVGWFEHIFTGCCCVAVCVFDYNAARPSNMNDSITLLPRSSLVVTMKQTRRGDESFPRPPSVDDDSEGHLVYKDGDILQARCTQQFHIQNLVVPVLVCI